MGAAGEVGVFWITSTAPGTPGTIRVWFGAATRMGERLAADGVGGASLTSTRERLAPADGVVGASIRSTGERLAADGVGGASQQA